MIAALIDALNQAAQLSKDVSQGKYTHQVLESKFDDPKGDIIEIIFCPAEFRTKLKKKCVRKFVFHLVKNNECVSLIMKKFSNRREEKFKEVGYELVGTIIESDEDDGKSFELVWDDCRYPFRLDFVRFISYCCGISDGYSDEFYLQIERIRIHIKERTEVK